MKNLLVTFVLPLAGTLAFAADPAPADASRQPSNAAPTATASTNPAPAANPAAPERSAGISGDTSAKVSEGLPRFTPPPPPTAPLSPVGTPAPLPAPTSGTDFTENGIIRLPNYDVREEDLPEFKERELLTREGRVDEAMTRFPGLDFGPLAQLNRRVGLVLLEQEYEVERLAELRELYDFMAFMRTVPRSTANPASDSSAAE